VKALVTGATGFIGSHIARELLNSGVSVRALVRKNSDRRNLAGVDAEIVEGDILDRSSISSALKNCDTLFHAAADYRLWTKNPAAMYAANVEGTENVLEAALSAGVGKVVYTSSVGTLGNPGDGNPGDEDTPVSFSDMVGDYKKSKFLAERKAESFLAKGLQLVIVNPSTPVGPFDIKPTPTGKIIVDFVSRRMPAYLETGLNLIAVEDCARGHILAAEKGRIGEKYILGNENLMLDEIFEMLSRISGVPKPRFCLPYGPILVAAWVNEAFSTITGREPMIPLSGVRMAKKLMFFSPKKARMELVFETTPVYNALERALGWFRANGYLK